MKKVVVIGSNCFSGSDFVDLLLSQGSYEVLGISRSPEKASLFLPYKKRDLSRYQFFQCDLNQNLDALEKRLDSFQPEYIINFAALSEVALSWQFPQDWFQINTLAVTRLAYLLKDKSYLKKYVHISTPEVYGTCEGIVTEKTPLNPSTPYAASKAAGDLSLFTFFKHFSFPLTVVRATNVYGPHQQLYKIIPRSVIYMKNQMLIPLHGAGKAVKSFIHIRDVSRGELKVMEQGRIGEIYHISPDAGGISVHALVSMISSYLKVSFSKAVQLVEERLGQDKAYVIDSTKIRDELGWKPQISLEQGIEQTIAWVEENFEEIQKQPLQYIHQA